MDNVVTTVNSTLTTIESSLICMTQDNDLLQIANSDSNIRYTGISSLSMQSQAAEDLVSRFKTTCEFTQIVSLPSLVLHHMQVIGDEIPVCRVAGVMREPSLNDAFQICSF